MGCDYYYNTYLFAMYDCDISSDEETDAFKSYNDNELAHLSYEWLWETYYEKNVMSRKIEEDKHYCDYEYGDKCLTNHDRSEKETIYDSAEGVDKCNAWKSVMPPKQLYKAKLIKVWTESWYECRD